MGGWDDNKKFAVAFKIPALDFGCLTEPEGYKAAPYFASRGIKWMQQFHSAKEKEG